LRNTDHEGGVEGLDSHPGGALSSGTRPRMASVSNLAIAVVNDGPSLEANVTVDYDIPVQ